MIETIKDVVNIIFFITVGLVTVFSFLQAKKTIFAPIRTETFKLQLRVFEEILMFFQNKTESDFLDVFDLHRIASLNTLLMADRYAELFFPGQLKIDERMRKERLKPLIGAFVAKANAHKYFARIDGESITSTPLPDKGPIDNPAIALAQWHEYEHGMVEFTNEYQEQIKELVRIAASPLLPIPLREKLGEFERLSRENLMQIGEAITECSKSMPKYFPHASDLVKFTPSWVWNEFNAKREQYKPKAKEILDYMNDYLKIDDLMV